MTQLWKVNSNPARLVKKNYHTQRDSTDNYRFGSSDLMPVMIKKKKCDENQIFYLYALGCPAYTLEVSILKDKHTMVLASDEGICSSYSFWFYKKKNKLSRAICVHAKHCDFYHIFSAAMICLLSKSSVHG